eukprot:1386444-Rhodomonas_salina.1
MMPPPPPHAMPSPAAKQNSGPPSSRIRHGFACFRLIRKGHGTGPCVLAGKVGMQSGSASLHA